MGQAVNGDLTAAARLITSAERGALSDVDMGRLHAASEHCHVIGVTGASGSGKSTLVAALARTHRSHGRRLAVLAVDPTSPYSGGAILGDRIRMSELSDDPEFFVRSMATRGTMGGLARATGDAVTILAASGRDMVIIETVGVGQDEVEIATASHTTVVVSVPGLGDDVQAMKAGVLEIADIHVVNKADLDGADRVIAQLRDMLRLGRPTPATDWCPPVLAVSARDRDGIDELVAAVDDHRTWLVDNGQWAVRESEIAEARIRAALTELLMQRVEDPTTSADLRAAIDAVRRRRTSPRAAAAQLLDRAANLGSLA